MTGIEKEAGGCATSIGDAMNTDISKEQAERLANMSNDKFIEWVSGYSFPADILTVAKDAWQAALTQQAGVNAEGWKLVPVEPTIEMKLAAQTEYNVTLYKAMIDAAPKFDGNNDLVAALQNHLPYKDESGVISFALHDYGRIMRIAAAPSPQQQHADHIPDATIMVQGDDELVKALKVLIADKKPKYHDCIDDGEPECAWCLASQAIANYRARKGEQR